MNNSFLLKTGMIVALALFSPAWAQGLASVDDWVENSTQTHVSAGRDATLTSAQIAQTVSVGRDLTGTACTIGQSASVGRDTTLSHCTLHGTLSTGRALKLAHSQVHGDVTVGGNATLVQSEVDGLVTLGGHGVFNHSTLHQQLTVADTHLVVMDSHLTSIRVNRPQSTMGSVINGVSIQSGAGGRSVVHVGPHSQSLVNGYTVRSTDSVTVVITPNLWIYQNGVLKSGQGPKTYSLYQEQTPLAPFITGPGWSESRESSLSSQPFDAVVELMGETQVSGDITFEAGHGQVLIHPPAVFQGKVIGGHKTLAKD